PHVIADATAGADERVVIDAQSVHTLRRDVDAEVAFRPFVGEQIAARGGSGGVKPHLDGERAGAKIERGIVRDTHAAGRAIEVRRAVGGLKSAEGWRPRAEAIEDEVEIGGGHTE